MSMKLFVLILSAAIVVSLFMPWLNAPIGASLVPWDLISQMNADDLRVAPPLILGFIVSFALAALLVVLCLTNSENRLVAFFTGALPLGLLAFVIFQASDELSNIGLPQPQTADFRQLFEQAVQVLGYGAFTYFGSAALLLLISLFDRGGRNR